MQLRKRRSGLLAIAALLAIYGWMAQPSNWNQDAHYALVKSLAEGTPYVDKNVTRPQSSRSSGVRTGDVSAEQIGKAITRHGDLAYFHGHVYAAKAPGLAFAALPAYVLLKAVHRSTVLARDPTGALWFLGLFAVVLPSAVLLLLVRSVADRLEPGYGSATAVILGLCTLVLPFSTLFFAHVLSATLGFAAFALVYRTPAIRHRLPMIVAAGVCAGLAITAEYTLALVAGGIAVYTFAQRRALSDVASLAAGTMIGILPLLIFQRWAFGSAFHVAYAGVRGNRTGLFGVGAPHWSVAGQLLFATVGLLRLSPVLVLSVAGAAILFQLGKRHESVLALGIAAAYLVVNSAYSTPFGGLSPGPRFLIPALPFLVLPLSVILRRLPLTALALAAPSAVLMLTVTATDPLLAGDGNWFSRLTAGRATHTLLNHLLDPYRGSLPIVLFFTGGVVAAGLAAFSLWRIRLSRVDVAAAISAFLSWLLVSAVASQSPTKLILPLAIAFTGVVTATALRSRREPGEPAGLC